LACFYLDSLSYVTARDHLAEEGGREGGAEEKRKERKRWTEGQRESR
jgi:hypothetical protein